MKEETLRYNLKMTVDLHATLTEHAKKNKRSLQSEIIQRLEQSLSFPKPEELSKNKIDIFKKFEDEYIKKEVKKYADAYMKKAFEELKKDLK
ncbi:Arc family DNA-binding protein [Commensalibacter melissae]|uniref:Arc family DNA-binding protein n=1 Tax=Commensalibacter melissae TaxID=2070537 RepID=UPI000EFC4592|nr:Arc family DNA-binding protein [Commensalibacter melissae]AYN86301.1 Arc family DNA-binding protein [Commensalibacter melissae]